MEEVSNRQLMIPLQKKGIEYQEKNKEETLRWKRERGQDYQAAWGPWTLRPASSLLLWTISGQEQLEWQQQSGAPGRQGPRKGAAHPPCALSNS